jgi:vitamin B12 transporter
VTLLALGLVALATQIAIDEDADELVVRSTRLGQLAGDAATSVTVLTSEDLRRLGVVTLLDALATAPGVTINRAGPFGGVASLRVRGAASDQTLVIIDGVPVGDPSAPGGGADLARLEVSEIERVEILRGPQATLWGSEAIGGVVLITTKRPAEGTALRAFAETGSFEQRRLGAGADLVRGPWAARLSVSRQEADGLSKADRRAGNEETDPYEATTLGAALRYAGSEGRELAISHLRIEAEAAFDGFDGSAPGFVADADETADTSESVTSLSAVAPLFGGRLTNNLLLGHTRIDRQNFAAGDPTFSAQGERWTARYQGDVAPRENLAIAFGAEGDWRESGGASRQIASGFALAEWKPTEKLTISSGLRLDAVEDAGEELSTRIAAAYKIMPALVARMSYGEGFKAPSLFQADFFCCGATEPNSALAPERSDGIEIGLRLDTARLQIDTALFRLETENLIDFSFVDGRYVNIAEAVSEGAEVEVTADLLPWLGLHGSYAYIDAQTGAGDPLLRVPRHSGTVSLSFTPYGPFSANLLARFNGEEEDSAGIIDPWSRIDLSAAYRLTPSAEVYGRLENLTNRSYQEVLGYGTAPRSGQVGVRLRF